MAGRCSICNHKKRKLIESEIISGVSLRSIAKMFDLSPTTLARHNRKCVSLAISTEVKGNFIEKKDAKTNTLSGKNILGNLKKLEDSLEKLKKDAAADGQYSASIAAVKEQIRMGENLLKRAEDLIKFEQSQNKEDTDYKEDLPGDIGYLLNTILNDPDLSDEVEAEYSIVS